VDPARLKECEDLELAVGSYHANQAVPIEYKQ